VINLASFVEDIPNFHQKSDAEKIEVFGWYLHEIKQQERFGVADLHGCFDAVHITRPANTSNVLARLSSRKPARVLKDSQGYRLAAPARTDLGQKFSVRTTTVRTTALLDGLVTRVTDDAQKTFLVETLTCFKNKAYRAAIVMAWNLAFSDVMDRILKSHLVEFNTQRAKAFPKTGEVKNRSDFEEFKESTIIEIARGAGILSPSSARILKEKLDKRNTAAHPSVVVVRDVTAEEVIHDLVENIILRPTL
jgi:hypothetical protein